ncbi:MAG: hypothetical protein IJJ72_06570 [Bacteroidales bacterium]|nr:hypothetical protein [Bacteroidales bacterium]
MGIDPSIIELGRSIIIEIVLTLCVVGIILYFQFKTYTSTVKKIKNYRDIFTSHPEVDCTIKKDENTGFVNGISCSHYNVTLNAILNSINQYLANNKGSIADYHLIKDIVDRNCDSVDEEISSQVPIPLYYGLMGTMAGIIIGVLSLIICGDLHKLLGATGAAGSGANGITALLLGVGLAMIASIFGIILTTVGSSKAKDSKVTVEANKNTFLSWIQASLLPELSSDAAEALHHLAANLNDFNNTFSVNNNELKETLQTVKEATKDQGQLLQKINHLNITRIATANVEVYDHLRNCTEEIGQFGQYVHGINNYVNTARELIQKLDDANERTRLIEEMAQFFKDERANLEAMKSLISTTIGDTDVRLSEAVSRLTQSTTSQFSALQTHLQERQFEFNRVVSDEQTNMMNALVEHRTAALNSIAESRRLFDEALAQQMESMKQTFQSRIAELDSLTEELKNMRAVKDILHKMQESSADQGRKFDNLSSAIKALASSKAGVDISEIEKLLGKDSHLEDVQVFPRWIKVLLYVVGGLVCAACIAILYTVLFKS